MHKIINILVILFLVTFAYSQNPKTYNGEIINQTDAQNKKQGKWVFFDKKGNKTEEGNFINNRKDGLWKAYYSSGKIKNEIIYQGNRPNGFVKFYYENGIISEQGEWKINKWVGEYKYFHKNGNLAYDWKYAETGKRTGEQKYYYEDGSLMIKGNWDNGKKEGILKEFYPDGSVKSEIQFDEGKINVSSIKEYQIAEKPSGKIVAPKIQKTKAMDKNFGVFDGTGYYRSYNEHKKIDREGNFIKGKLTDGKRYFYNENGELIKEIIYKKGKIYEVIDHSDK